MANYLKQSDGKTLTFHVSNKSYADGLHQLVLEPLAANGGFDFWWTDWQQGLQGMPGVGTTDVAGLNPTMWLNHYRTMNYTQPNSTRRPQIHSRFGGLGGHRYTSQFGGDVVQDWDSLLAMIYTTTISSNVLTVHWAQEIMQPKGKHELFTRVAQMGAWSPVFTIWEISSNLIIFGRMMTSQSRIGSCTIAFDATIYVASIQVYSSSNSTLRRHWAAAPNVLRLPIGCKFLRWGVQFTSAIYAWR